LVIYHFAIHLYQNGCIPFSAIGPIRLIQKAPIHQRKKFVHWF
jgi:hypothetical protein